MPKLKTNKTAKKRLHITAGKKILHRYATQDHFNARDTGKMTRAKRLDRTVHKAFAHSLKKLLPYE